MEAYFLVEQFTRTLERQQQQNVISKRLTQEEIATFNTNYIETDPLKQDDVTFHLQAFVTQCLKSQAAKAMKFFHNKLVEEYVKAQTLFLVQLLQDLKLKKPPNFTAPWIQQPELQNSGQQCVMILVLIFIKL